MIPKINVTTGPTIIPAFFIASPIANIPDPTLPLNKCIKVSTYLKHIFNESASEEICN